MTDVSSKNCLLEKYFQYLRANRNLPIVNWHSFQPRIFVNFTKKCSASFHFSVSFVRERNAILTLIYDNTFHSLFNPIVSILKVLMKSYCRHRNSLLIVRTQILII